jgi:hypothetical protein
MSNKKTKAKEQLGMDFGKASYILNKDLLFSLIEDISCYRCGLDLTREDFSIDHKIAWRNNIDAFQLFFDLDNIAYSHKNCNSSSRTIPLQPCGTIASYNRGCRCDECKSIASKENKKRKLKPYSSEERRARYLKYEK